MLRRDPIVLAYYYDSKLIREAVGADLQKASLMDYLFTVLVLNGKDLTISEKVYLFQHLVEKWPGNESNKEYLALVPCDIQQALLQYCFSWRIRHEVYKIFEETFYGIKKACPSLSPWQYIYKLMAYVIDHQFLLRRRYGATIYQFSKKVEEEIGSRVCYSPDKPYLPIVRLEKTLEMINKIEYKSELNNY